MVMRLPTEKIVILAVSFLMMIILISQNSAGFQEEGPDTGGMPDYAGSITVGPHYLIITQDGADPQSIVVEEMIRFNNTGNTSYTGELFLWYPPEEILRDIYQLSYIINDTFEPTFGYQNGNFISIDLADTNRTLEPNETIKIVFEYRLEYPGDRDTLEFNRTFLYETKDVVVMVIPVFGYVVTTGSNLDLILQEDSGVYVTNHTESVDLGISDSISIDLAYPETPGVDDDDDDDDDNSSFYLFLIIGGMILLFIAVFIILKFKLVKEDRVEDRSKKVGKKGKSDKIEKKDRSPKAGEIRSSSKNELRDWKKKEKMISKTTDRLKSDYRAGLISKEIYNDLRKKYKNEKRALDERFLKLKEEAISKESKKKKSKTILELEEKKETILSAIEKLDNDKDAGIIDKDLHKELMKAYKKKAVDILKKIDSEREKKP